MRGLITILCVFVGVAGFAQKEKLNLIKGNEAYASGNYSEAETKYLDAITDNPNYIEGNFNLGDALFRQEKYEDAARYFNQIAENAPDAETKAKAFHNLGNSLLKAQKLGESINAYKQALKLNPLDNETRYNLSYALKLQQQQQQQQQQNQDQNKDQNENKDENKDQNQDKENQQNQDKQDQKQDKNQDQQDQQNQNKGDQDEQQKQDQQQQQQELQKGDKISKDDAARMLEALQLQEKNTQEKLKKERLKNAQKIKIEKDW